MRFALTRLESQIYILNKDTNQQGVFDRVTGVKLRGELDMDPEMVLFMAWRQTQSPNLSNGQLQENWAKLRQKNVNFPKEI